MACDYFLFAVFLTAVTAPVPDLGSVAAGFAVVVAPAPFAVRRALRPLRPFSAVALALEEQQLDLPSCAVAVVLPLQHDFEHDFFTSVFCALSAGFFSVVVWALNAPAKATMANSIISFFISVVAMFRKSVE